MNRKMILRLAKNFQLSLNDEVMCDLEKEFNILEQELIKLKKVDVKNIEPMFMIDETPISISILREDIPEETLTLKQVLKNAACSKDDFITYNKKDNNEI